MNKTYIAIVLDRSGSMEYAKKQTISGMNEQIQTIKEDASINSNIETLVSLITFNNRVNVEFVNKPTNILEELTETSYMPNGGTALLDGIKVATDILEAEKDMSDPNNAALIVIYTDGGENASTQVSAADLAKKIKELEGKGNWTFSFMGAEGFGLEQLAKSININSGNTMTFSAQSGAGYLAGMSSNTNGVSNFIKSRSAGLTQTRSFYNSNPIDDIDQDVIDADRANMKVLDKEKKNDK